MVVKQVLHVLEAAIGGPNLASAGPCEVRVLLVIDSVELTAETQDDTDANLKGPRTLDVDSSCRKRGVVWCWAGRRCWVWLFVVVWGKEVGDSSEPIAHIYAGCTIISTRTAQ